MPDKKLEIVLTKLAIFQDEHDAGTKGPLATLLFMTRKVQESGLPFPSEKLRTDKKGQVAGLGREPVQKILLDYGIKRVLAEEGGRTSRGSLGLAENYVTLLNDLSTKGLVDAAALKQIESWWVDRIKEYFNRQCFKVDIDHSLSISKVVALVLEAARERQKEMPHVNVEGTVLQHLVGAKLSLALGMKDMKYHKASEADLGRAGDFELADSVIHVTTAPGENLFAKCKRNIQAGLRPIVVCPHEKTEGATMLADNAGIKDRVEVYNAEGFISMNVNELAQFKGERLRTTVGDLLNRYNEIVENTENDTSLRIETR